MVRPRIDATTLLDRLPVGFTHQTALRNGLSRAVLARLQADGTVERFAPGLYLKVDAGFVDLDLLEAALRAPLSTICLTSALAHHHLIDEIPHAWDLALPRGCHRSVGPAVAAWHQYDPVTFDIGREHLAVADGIPIGLYDAPRSIVDAFNPRLGIPREQAVEAVRNWLRRRGSQPSTLMKYAKHWPHAQSALRTTLQVLL